MKTNLYLKCLAQSVIGCLVGKALFLWVSGATEKFINPSLFVYMVVLFMVRVFFEKRRIGAGH
ncbi:hypothetical protein ACPRNU_23990 [Chromobacterium vaccinii]|uniref:hypothetical protein n=1 Tax=Chromobacterium vaccinii TaxID=1108595 RepID=UPI003C715057